MQRTVCPSWLGYFLLNPLRKLFENPDNLIGPFVKDGMVILEPGCGMGYFTLPMARLVGPSGRVIAADIQEKMILALKKRAEKAGLSDRMDLRVIEPDNMRMEGLHAAVDLVVAIHMVHEVPDRNFFFQEMVNALKPGGKLFMVEPKGHVSRHDFESSIDIARKSGLQPDPSYNPEKKRRVLLYKYSV
jgi:ubiquinone/menaquinone biosynthesis C-methylase UbiE